MTLISARSDRYNHDAESGDDDAPMFCSFTTASPRHSIVGIDGQQSLLPPDWLARKASAQSDESAESGFVGHVGSGGGRHSANEMDSDLWRHGNEPIPTV